MSDIWIQEPTGEEFEFEMREDEEEDKELSHKAKALTKQISRRLSMSLIIKWLYAHGKEPHGQTEISEALKLSQGTVSFNLNRASNVGVVKIIRLKGLDIHPLYSVNRTIGRLVTKRFLWLVSFKLLKVLPKTEDISLEELKSNGEFIQIMKKFRLSFPEVLESLGLNHYVEILLDREREPYGIRLKDLPLQYYKQEKVEAEQAPEEVM